MKQDNLRSRWHPACCAAASLLGLCATGQRAGAMPLLFDVRVHGTGGKDATVSNPGDTLLLDLYAVVTGADADPNNDSTWGASGGFFSSNGQLLGDLVGLPPVPPFNGPATGPGLPQDLDSDGDLDIGSNIHTQPGPFYNVLDPSGTIRLQPPGGLLLGQVRFTATGLADATTDVNYFLRNGYQYGAWLDGVGTALSQSSGMVGVGTPVTIHATDVTPIGSATFLGGTINEHLVVDGHVRAAPGQTLVLNNGVTVNHGALLNTRDDAGNYGAHELRVSDSTSCNNGGAMFINSMNVGVAAPGQFTQTGGLSRFKTSVVVGAAAGNAGTLLVTGGSLIDDGTMTLGAAAQGSYLQDGGFVTVGTLSMTGAGGNDSSFDIAAGQFTATRQATIGGAGSGAAKMRIGGTGQANINGTLLLNADGPNGGELEISAGGLFAGAARFVSGTSVTQSGGTVAPSLLSIGRPQLDTSAVATYQLDDGTLNFGTAFVGDQAHGTLIQTGGHVVSGGILHLYDTYDLRGGDARTWGVVINEPSGNLAGLLDQSGGTLETDFLDVKGTYRISGGTFQVNKQLRVPPGGTIDFANGGAAMRAGNNTLVELPADGLANAGGASLVGEYGSLVNYQPGHEPRDTFANVQTQGILHEQGTPLNIAAGQLVGGQGTISGNTTNAGLLRPGVGAGELDVVGSFTQTADASLDIELGGTNLDQHDLLSVFGPASLDGQLDLSLIDHFVPMAEDSFTILSVTGGLAGQFANTAGGQVFFDGGRFDVLYSANGVTLTNFAAVPEPNSTLIFSGAIVSASAIRRRRGGRGRG